MNPVSLQDVRFIGAGLARPECVIATRSGELYVPDRRGGVTMLSPDGAVHTVLAQHPPADFMPNGIALLPDRSWLIANLGPTGGVWHMDRDGVLTPKLLAIDGAPIQPTNFVGIDRAGRIWVTVSTRLVPREQSMKKGYGDGYIVRIDERGAAVVATGLGFTNEAIVDPGGEYLYVNETIARCTSRFAIYADGALGPREVFARYGAGTWPDGFAFDVEGGVWIVSVVSNRVIRAMPDGTQTLMLEDNDPRRVAGCEAAFQNGTFNRSHLDAGRERRLANLSGIAFGGPDLRTVYLGSLFGKQLATFRSPVAGAAPVHWAF